jgi:hypothetical protein
VLLGAPCIVATELNLNTSFKDKGIKIMKLRTALTGLLLAVAVVVAGSFSATAQSTVKNYFAGCQGANCDNVGTFGGTINVPSGGVLNIKSGGAIQNDGVAINLTDSGVTNAVAGVAASYKVARGTVTLDGTNPSSATTGLTAILACTVTDKRSTAPALDPTAFTIATAAVAGRLDIYAWKPTGSGDATLIASTDADDTIDWVCVGT